MVLERFFYKKLKVGEILFQSEGALSIYEHPFFNHHNIKGKGHVLVVSISRRDVEGYAPIQP